MSYNFHFLKQHEKFITTIFIKLNQLQNLINSFSNIEMLININDLFNFHNEASNLYNYVSSYLNKNNTLNFCRNYNYYYNYNNNIDFGLYLNTELKAISEPAELLYSNRTRFLNGISTHNVQSWYTFLHSIVTGRINNLKITLKETIIKTLESEEFLKYKVDEEGDNQFINDFFVN